MPLEEVVHPASRFGRTLIKIYGIRFALMRPRIPHRTQQKYLLQIVRYSLQQLLNRVGIQK
jgi:hypothetical protein